MIRSPSGLQETPRKPPIGPLLGKSPSVIGSPPSMAIRLICVVVAKTIAWLSGDQPLTTALAPSVPGISRAVSVPMARSHRLDSGLVPAAKAT